MAWAPFTRRAKIFEAYAVGVRLTLVNQVSTGLISLASQFQGLNRHVTTTQNLLTDVERKIANLKRVALVGGVMAGAGGFGLSLFKGPLEEAAEYQKEVAKLSVMGVGDKAVKEAEKYATSMNIMGQSARDNMKLIREAYAVTGDMHHAEALAPQLARMKFGIDSVLGEGHGAGAQTMMMDLLKTAELRGAANDPATFARMTNLAMKAYIASGGTVAPRDFLQAMKTGGVAAKGLSDEAFFFQGLHTMQEFGGNRYGTAMMSAYQNLAQGKGSLRAAKELVGMGLIDPKMIEYTTTGTIKQIKPGALKDSFLLAQNQFEYYEKEVAPKLAGLSKDQAFLKIGSMFSNRTAANLFSTFYNDAPSIKRVFGMAKQADGIDGLYGKAGETAAGKMVDLQAKYRDVLKNLGEVFLPIAITGLEKITGVLQVVVDLTHEFPTLTKGMVGLFGVMSLAMAGGGAVLLLRAGLQGLQLAMGAAGLAGTVGGLLSPIGLAVTALGALALALGLFSSGDKPKPHREVYVGLGHNPLATSGEGINPVSTAAQRQPFKQSGDVYLDKRKVGKILYEDMGREVSRPQASASNFDGGLGLAPFALTSLR